MSPPGQINREKQKGKTGRDRESRCAFWSDDAAGFLHYDVCVVSVGIGDSLAVVEAASVGSVGLAVLASPAAVTVTEAVGAVVETGRSGATP